MNISSGISIAGGSLAVAAHGGSLQLLRKDCEPRTLVAGYDGIRYLAVSSYGEYLAFWSFTGESFRLIDLAGQAVWSSWMNSDKAVPVGIKFSASGDAVVCLFHFEGLPGMFFCDFKQGFSTTFGCSGSPIGHDADLRYFAIDSCDPHEGSPFYELAGPGGNVVVPPRVISQRLKQNPLIVDRKRCLLPNPVVPLREWQGLAIQDGLAGFVILKDCNLYWFSRNSAEPETTIPECLQENDRYESFRTVLSVCGDNVLIQIGDRSTVANRNHGVVWRGNGLSSTAIRGRRVLAQYSDGTVEAIQSDGSVETRCAPPSGYQLVAADIADDVLRTAYLSKHGGRVEVKETLLR